MKRVSPWTAIVWNRDHTGPAPTSSYTSVFGYHRWGISRSRHALDGLLGAVLDSRPLVYVSESNGSCLNASGTLSHLRDTPEALQEAITLWSGSCGLATCHVITIFRLPHAPAVCRWNTPGRTRRIWAEPNRTAGHPSSVSVLTPSMPSAEGTPWGARIGRQAGSCTTERPPPGRPTGQL
jgi:hypothetical protein